MSSSWQAEIAAVLRKEWLTETRSRTGLLTAGLFSVATVVAISFGAMTVREMTGTLAAGLLWVALAFAGLISLPRAFVAEEESGTGDLLRLLARPHAVFWGKALFNVVQMLLTSTVLALLFTLFAGLHVENVPLFALGLVGGSCALAGAVTLCAALVAQGSNRSALIGAMGVPVLLPLIALGVAAFRAALGDGLVESSTVSAAGLWLYAVVVFAIGPWLFAAVWKA